jgi:hypothetical protein
MIVNELSNELGIKNKDLIEFLKSNGFKVSSHMQTVTDEMIAASREKFSKPTIGNKTEESKKVEPVKKTTKKTVPAKNIKKFAPDDLIPCRSITPWYLETIGIDRMTTYKWPNYGAVEYVAYRDLQSWRRKPVVKDAMILIEDPDICEQWKNDLGTLYKKYLAVEYPEEFFDIKDSDFEQMLRDASDVFREVIKYTAIDMIRNENYPSLQKLTIIDNVLGTGIKEFI